MCPGPLCLYVGVGVLFVPCSVLPQAGLYGQQSHRFHRTPPCMTASPWAFFYDPFTQLSCHLLHIAAIDAQFVGYLFIRQIQSHEVETQYPHFQWLMMSGKNGIGQIIKPCVTVHTLIALTG